MVSNLRKKGVIFTIVFVCSIFIFAFTSTGIIAHAWGAPGQYGTVNYSSTQSSMTTVSSLTTVTASDHSYGATSSKGLSATHWTLANGAGEQSGLFVHTVKLSDNLYHALLAGKLKIVATVTAKAQNKHVGTSHSTHKIKSFVSIGTISGTGLARDNFMQTASATGNEHMVDKIQNTTRDLSSTATYTGTPSSGQYIRYGISAQQRPGSGAWLAADAYMHSISMKLTISANGDSAAPTISSGTNSYATSSYIYVGDNNSVGLSDTGSNLWYYTVGGTNRATYGAKVSSTSISLTQADNGKALVVYDNLGNNTSRTIRWYAPTVYAKNYLDGSLVSNTIPGTIKIDNGGAGYSVVGNGKTVNNYYDLVATPNEGYYLDSWQKTSGETGTYRTSTTQRYTISESDYSTSSINWQANFYSISTTDKIVTYNGNEQKVDTPSGLNSSFSVRYRYTGNTESGESYNSDIAPTIPGIYNAKVSIISGSNEMGYKNVALIITRRDVTITANDVSQIYGDSATSLTYSLSGGLGSGDSITGALIRVSGNNVDEYAITQGSLSISNVQYYNLTFVNGVYAITKRPITVSADPKTIIYGDDNLPLTYKITSGELVYDDSFTGSLGRQGGNNVGAHDIILGTLSISAIDNYNVTYNGAKYTINKRPITITAQYGEKTFGENDLLSYAITNGQLYFGDTMVGSLTRESGEDVGTYTIQQGSLSISAIDNYSWTFVPSTYTIKIARPFAIDVFALITYESALKDEHITATVINEYNGDTVYGKWTWDIGQMGLNFSMPEVSQSGTYSASFTPTDTHNYLPITANVELTVERQQQQLTFEDICISNNGVGKESQVPSLADYEVCYDIGTITLTAYTTAVYPTARPIDFNIDTRFATLVDNQVSIVTINGTAYSKTTVTLKINTTNTYGIVEITANQFDSNTNPGGANHREHARGNYVNPQPIRYKLFIKQAHRALSFDDISLEYGQADWMIEPQLNSGRTDFRLVSNNPNIATINTASTAFRMLTIQNAGTATLTLSHDGYVNINDLSSAYMAFEQTITVNIDATELYITLTNLTITYGDTPTFSYSYQGLVYDEIASDVIVGLTNNYDANIMKNVIKDGSDFGAYTITPKDATNVSYPNYNITFIPGKLTVTPRTIVVSVNNATKVYGEVTPLFDISYDGFIQGEDASMSGLVLPSVDYGEIAQFCNVGTYPITLTAGSANNYIFDTATVSILTILPRAVNIDVIATDMDYSGLIAQVDCNVYGIDNELASTPVNKDNANAIRYSFSLDGDNWFDNNPVNVGLYHVRVTYYAGDNDNYSNTTIEFSEVFSILAVNPILQLENKNVDYSSYGVDITGYAYPITHGSQPIGNLSYMYSMDGISFSDIPQKDAGVYTVMITYHPLATDNYKTYSQTFENVLTINKVSALLALEDKETTYHSSNGIIPDRVVANVASAYGVGLDYDTLEQDNRFSYEYFVDGEWVQLSPFNAGVYAVRVTYVALSTENYLTTIKEFTKGVTIKPADISSFISLETLYADYNGSNILANDAEYSGIPGGSQPMGTISYEYQLGSSGFTAIPVKNANTYNVKVIYTTVAGDNYANTSKIFVGALEILKIAPTITLPSFRYEFDGAERSVIGSVKGIAEGQAPLGRLSYRYMIDNAWSFDGPRNAGVYSIEVSYISGAEDNYKDYTADIFVGGLVITQARPDIYLESRRYDYTGQGVSATGATVVGKTQDQEGPKGSISYQYFIDKQWISDAPMNSGSYNVKVIFTAVDGTNYVSIEKIYTNALIIRNIAPDIALAIKRVIYNGTQVLASQASVTNGDGEAKGYWSYEYNMGGNSWTSRAPINAGTYDIMVRYNEAETDNYSTKSTVFYGALVIMPIDITVTPQNNQSKIYDGEPIDGDTILFNRIELISGNLWSGALRAGTLSTAGEYRITLGTLSAGSNYRINFTENIIYTIEKREVVLMFPSINTIYDGYNKQPVISVDNSKLVAGDIVSIYTRYEGDTLNVGTFLAVANMDDNNYKLPESFTLEYSITPARMVGNSFSSYQTTYDKNPHRIALTSIVDGATVVYDRPTEYISRGIYTVTATISKPNYYNEILSATLTINKGVFNVSVQKPEKTLYYGDPLPSISCNISEGYIFLDQGQELIPGEHDYSWSFIPYDTENYEEASGTIKLDVNKSETKVSLDGALTQYINNPQALKINVVSSNSNMINPDNATIYYTDTFGNVYTTLPTAPGRYTVSVTYQGDDYHAPATHTAVVIIKPKSNKMWIWVTLGILGGLTVASIAYFTARARKRV